MHTGGPKAAISGTQIPNDNRNALVPLLDRFGASSAMDGRRKFTLLAQSRQQWHASAEYERPFRTANHFPFGKNHFRWTRGWRVVGVTPTGRVTITALGMNRPAIVAIRKTLALLRKDSEEGNIS